MSSLALTLAAVPAHAATLTAVPQAGARGSERVPVPGAAEAAPRGAAFRAPATETLDDYTVQPGDTVSAIAGRHGLSTAEVLAANALTPESIIYPGQVLRMTGTPAPQAPIAAPPAPQAPASSDYEIVDGDTISGIASSHGIATRTLLDANGLDETSIVYPGQQIVIPGAMVPASATPPPSGPENTSAYVVQAGDTVTAIAQAHGLSTQAILDANGLTRASIIYPGESITIPGPDAVAAPPAVTPPAETALDEEQRANAALIIRIGRELGVPDRGIEIALGTAMQESWLRNLGWGDRDSLGLFQQRPSTGWGTPDEVGDPAYATRSFFLGATGADGTRTLGLLDIAGWEDMSFADAAQAVQISAHPDRYAGWELPASQWLAALG
ncbi:muramidase family protein [Microbacterium rhizomatis]|uniref:muramidase family protein n=1 Tax=Microbacterium rhizomatis TaxID=1631477 RepID=UPI001FE6B436|nr:LysM peptidoglycan-binding domain-containing protein [Microbacterium rhizomatis]